MERRGKAPTVLGRRPELLSQAAWLFERYFEIDRDGMVGRPTTAGMLAVLDLYGIGDRDKRIELCAFWRAMASTELELRERQRKRDEEKRETQRKGMPKGRRPRPPAEVETE